MKIEQSQAVVVVSTNSSTGCPFFCGQRAMIGGDSYQQGINHLISEHGCVLLHVGSETSHADNGQLWHGTMATLASPVPLPEPPRVEIKFVGVQPPSRSEE